MPYRFGFVLQLASGRPLPACVLGGWHFACRMPNNLRCTCIRATVRAASRTS